MCKRGCFTGRFHQTSESHEETVEAPFGPDEGLVVVYNGGQSEGPDESDRGFERRRVAVYELLSVPA